MPPPKKGDKSLEEDFSDVPTLPPLNSLIFTLALDFKDKERRSQVSTKIKEEWKNKVRTITREEIIDYGKRKLTIAEDEDVKNIKKVAQAAAEKIFEQFVHARREKKEKIDKLKEEAKATATVGILILSQIKLLACEVALLLVLSSQIIFVQEVEHQNWCLKGKLFIQ